MPPSPSAEGTTFWRMGTMGMHGRVPSPTHLKRGKGGDGALIQSVW